MLVSSVLFSSGCAPARAGDGVNLYITHWKADSEKEIKRVRKIMREINHRNKNVEDSPEWLKEAYGSINIQSLYNIPKDDYVKYKRYSDRDGGRLYVIVHPAFYTFFQLNTELSEKSDARSYPTKNIVERLYDRVSIQSFGLRVMQEQERQLRDFIETASTEKKLILMVLPRNYKNAFTYGYIEGLDEYARFINEITNLSESAIYMYSVDYNNGALSDKDLALFTGFVKELDIKTIVLGGGYIGRCLEGFYRSILDRFDTERVFIVPEIAAASPEDIKGKWGDGLLSGDGRIDAEVAAMNLRTPNAYEQQEILPRVKRFYVHEIR